jgi:hypothetical protein
MDGFMFPWWRSRDAMHIGAFVLFMMFFKLNFFSPGWNILVGLAITFILLLLGGFIESGQSQ